MSDFKKILVCLDGSDWDTAVIRYASLMANLVSCQEAVFVHCAEANVDSSLQKKFDEKADQHFSYNCEKSVTILKGNNASDIMGWTDIESVDLIVMGIKPRSASSGKHAAKIVQGSLCSVLLVPVNTKDNISTVLLPMDFTENSLRSIKTVHQISTENPVHIIGQHVFYVPTGYSSTGKSYDEFASIMEQNKKKEYEYFKKKHEIQENGFEVVFTLDEDHKPSDNIYQLAKERNADLLVLGSTHRSKAASMLLFSTSLELLKYDEDIPCLIVKDKKENIGFFDALMKV